MQISSPVSGDTVCYGDQFEMVCWYPAVITPGSYLVQTPGWRVNGLLLTLDGIVYHEMMINITATKLVVIVTDAVNAFSCFLVLADTRLDDVSTQQVQVTIMGKWHARRSAIGSFSKWHSQYSIEAGTHCSYAQYYNVYYIIHLI